MMIGAGPRSIGGRNTRDPRWIAPGLPRSSYSLSYSFSFSHHQLHNYRMRAAIQYSTQHPSMIDATSSRSTPLCSTTVLQPSMPPGRRLAPTGSSGPERPVVPDPGQKLQLPGFPERGKRRSTTAMSSWITTHSTAHGTHARTLLIKLSKGMVSCVSSTPPPGHGLHGV